MFFLFKKFLSNLMQKNSNNKKKYNDIQNNRDFNGIYILFLLRLSFQMS